MKTLIALSALFVTTAVMAQTAPSLYDIPLKDIDGKATSLAPYKGKVILIVNVASKCGYTPQYTALEAMHKEYSAKGFSVLGFPCNDYGGQEPGDAETIKAFCSGTYNVTFPLYEKLHTKGPEQHKLYTALTGKDSPFPGDVKWNFNKFLIGKDGKILKRFESATKPDSPEVKAAIEAALAAK
jgi:glutathione peroxidase